MIEQTDKSTQFASALYALNQTMKRLFESGDITLLSEMNHEVKQIYALQHGSDDPLMKACEVECGVIYRNFDMIIAVLRTTEDGVIDAGARSALDRLLHNIDEAVINLATALEIV